MFKRVIHTTQHKFNKITWKQPAVEIPWDIDIDTNVSSTVLKDWLLYLPNGMVNVNKIV